MPVQKPTLSPRDLARVVGVSESSLKRWADDGLLQISRTAGGHRRIGLAEAASYIRRSGLPLTDPKPLGLNDLSTLDDGVPLQQLDYLLVQAIRGGDRARACGLTLKLYLSGRSVCEICDGPMKHALRHDPIADRSVSVPTNPETETAICLAALRQLRELLTACEDRGGSALLLTDASSQPCVVIEMMKTVLAAECWTSIEVMPSEARTAAATPHIKLVAVPVELLQADESLSAQLADAVQSTGGQLVLVGGVFAQSSSLSRIESMSEFASLVRCVEAMNAAKPA